MSREDRKASRTAIQNAKVNAKHNQEANHFFSAARRNAGRRRPRGAGESERDLFKASDQGSGGINFDKWTLRWLVGPRCEQCASFGDVHGHTTHPDS